MKKVFCALLIVLLLLTNLVIHSFAFEYCYPYFNEGEYSSNTGQYVANIAKAQIGKTKAQLHYSVDWCSLFATDCARKAGVSESVFPQRGYAHDLVEFFMTNSESKVYFRQNSNVNGTFLKGDYTPKPGDVIGVCNDGNYNKVCNSNVGGTGQKRYCVDHIGVVVDYDSSNGWIICVEGNTDGGVHQYRYRWNSGSTNGQREYNSSTYIQYVCHPNYPDGADKVDVAEGVYIIQNVRDNNMVLDIQNNSTAVGANIQLYENVNTTVQKFKIVDKGDYYCIQSLYSGNWLDIASPFSDDFCNIQLWDRNDRTEQHWTFEDAGNGNVYIRSEYGAYIDTYNGGMSNGTNVNTFHFDGTTSQQWTLIRVSPYEKMTVADGIYFIRNVRDSGKCLDIQNDSTEVGANVMLYENNGNKVQKFKVVNKGNYCCIQSLYSGLWLDIASPFSADECNIQLWNRNDRREQHWVFENAGNGKVLIRSCYGEYVDCEKGKTDNRTNISTFHYDASTSQQWTLVKTTEKPTATLAVDSSNYITTDEVIFSFGGNNNGTYTLGLYKDGNRIDTVIVKGHTYKRTFPETGSYSAYMTAYSSPDYVDSDWVNWTVFDKPSKPVITGITPNANGTVTVKWSECQTNTRSYSLRFYKNGNTSEEILLNRVTTDTHYTYALPDGNYTVMVTAEGTGGFTHSEKSSLFTIKKNIVCELVLSVQQNKELLIGSDFVDKDLKVKAIYTDSSQKDVSSLITVSGFDKNTAGEQTITVSYEENGVTVSAYYTVTVLTPQQAADVNADNIIDINDISGILFVDNYGLKASGAQNAGCDANRDGVVDIADISLILSTNVYGKTL